MGLDVYVGSFTRYFTRDWKTIIQQAAEQGGPPVTVIHPDGDAAPPPADEVRPAVEAWREALSSALARHGAPRLEWDESAAAPYFTDKPAWDCYGALLLWAAYAEHPDLERPAANPLASGGDWTGDPAYRRSTAEGFGSSYGQLLHQVEIWLPADFSFTFGAPWVTGDDRRYGSCPGLLAQLDELNARTWKAPPDALARWLHDGADRDAPLEVAARFAFALLRRLASLAVEHRLPMLLDY